MYLPEVVESAGMTGGGFKNIVYVSTSRDHMRGYLFT